MTRPARLTGPGLALCHSMYAVLEVVTAQDQFLIQRLVNRMDRGGIQVTAKQFTLGTLSGCAVAAKLLIQRV